MDARRLRMDPFALAFGGLLVLTASFLLSRNSGAVVMCGFIAPGCCSPVPPAFRTGHWCH